MEHTEKVNSGWLRDVAKIDPEIAKPELWSNEFLGTVVPDGPVHEVVHKMRDLVAMLGPQAIESSICTAIVLGYLMGQQSIRKAS